MCILHRSLGRSYLNQSVRELQTGIDVDAERWVAVNNQTGGGQMSAVSFQTGGGQMSAVSFQTGGCQMSAVSFQTDGGQMSAVCL